MRTRSFDLVNRRVDGPELDDLAADVGDEAAVRRAARARELGHDAGHRAHGVGHDVDQLARARVRIRLAESGPRELVVEPVPREDRLEALHQRFAACCPGRTGS